MYVWSAQFSTHPNEVVNYGAKDPFKTHTHNSVEGRVIYSSCCCVAASKPFGELPRKKRETIKYKKKLFASGLNKREVLDADRQMP